MVFIVLRHQKWRDIVDLNFVGVYDSKRRGCPNEAGMKIFEPSKSAQCYSEKSLFENRSQRQLLVSSNYQRTQTWVKLLTNNCLQSEFIAQPLSKKNTFRFLDEAMYSYNQTQDSLYDPTELALHCIVRPEVDLTNGGHNRRRRYSSKKWCTSLIKRIPWSMWVLNAVLFSILDLLQKYHRTTEKENFFPHLVKTQVQAKNRSH